MTNHVVLEIEIENAAFAPEGGTQAASRETSRVLQEISRELSHAGMPSEKGRKIYDVNGNVVGSIKLVKKP